MWKVSILLLTVWFTYTDASLAAMSIDLGTQFIKVGIVKPGVPMEIVLNKESRRKTPNMLSIRNGERLFGDAAFAANVKYPDNVYANLIDLVGKTIDDPSVELFKKRSPYTKVEANGSSIVFPIGDTSYSVETLIAMILSNAKHFTEVYAEQSIKDVVITVPVYFGQLERLAIERAAKIANLNLLQLVNDGTAAGLGYGVFRRKEITEKPQRLLIYDMGAGKTTATLVEYKIAKHDSGKQPTMSVLGVGFDRTLGGLEITNRVRDVLVKKFREQHKTKVDVTDNHKAMAKISKEAERVKQVLSANVDTFAQIESVHEDKDFRSKFTRDELIALIGDLFDRVAAPITQALSMAQLDIAEVDQVVLMGAGTRIPRVQELIQQAVGGKELGRFLNTDEANAMGALFQAAHLSKGFKVKPFVVEELVLFPIQVNFVSKQKQESGEVLDKPITRTLFAYKSCYPTTRKAVSFNSFTDDFLFNITYSDLTHFTDKQLSEMGHLLDGITNIAVNGVSKAIEDNVKEEETEFGGVKVAFELDYSGIVRVHHAEALIKRKRTGVVESITDTLSGFFSSKKEEGEPSDSEEVKSDEIGSQEQGTGEQEEAKESTPEPADEPKTTPEEESAEETKTEESAEKEEKKSEEASKQSNDTKKDTKDSAKKNETKAEPAKKKIPDEKRVKLKTQFDYNGRVASGRAEVDSAKKILEEFEKVEKLKEERAAAENELESFAFESSLLLDDEKFIEFSTEKERETLDAEVKRVRAWLEDETSPETKTSEFRKNFNAVKDLVAPVKKRIDESSTIISAIADLEKAINSSMTFIQLDEKSESDFRLFEKNDTEAFAAKVSRVITWLETSKKSIEKTEKNADPKVTTAQVEAKTKALERETRAFMGKMKKIDLNKLKKQMDEEKAKKADKPKEESKEESKAEEKASADERKAEEPADSGKQEKTDEPVKTEL